MPLTARVVAQITTDQRVPNDRPVDGVPALSDYPVATETRSILARVSQEEIQHRNQGEQNSN